MTALLLWMAAFAYLLWVLYVFCMAMERAHLAGLVSPFAWALALPFIVFAIGLDVALNLTVACIVFAELPEYGEWTISQRLNRLARDTGWRGTLARWLARNLLDPYDSTGRHIR